MNLDLAKYQSVIEATHLTKDSGIVTEVRGLLMKGTLPGASVGSVVKIETHFGGQALLAEVVGFKDQHVLMMPLAESRGVSLGSKIILQKSSAAIKVHPTLLGRVIGALGEPLDGALALEGGVDVPLYKAIRNPLERRPIRQSLSLGVRAIDSCLTMGQGQRVAIMAGSGVGKSVLLGMIARSSDADINVIALIGERGREVREFIENDLGPEGLKKSVIVCVTSDQSALLRMRGAFVATAIAEYFSSIGKNVLLMMDSVTRFAMAQREIGLSAGEPPSSKGYTPSVFALLPKLLERAGSFEGEGSITGLYTTLVEGDDMNDPIGDSVRSIVDGHIVLSRQLAHKAHYPAIDILQSASRVMRAVSKPEHIQLAQKLREILAIYKESEDLIMIGAYKPGTNPKVDRAIKLIDQVQEFLKQSSEDVTPLSRSIAMMQKMLI